MDMSTIVGRLLSGAACSIYGAGFAIYMAYESIAALKPLGTVAAALG